MRPRTDGESVNSRTSFNLRRPSARTLRRWRAVQPFGLLNKRTRSFAPAAFAFALAIAEHLVDRLGDRDRHFACLAVTETDAAIAVADHRQSREAHLAAALDGLGDAVDRDQLLEEAVAVFTIVLGCHGSPFCRPRKVRTFACGW